MSTVSKKERRPKECPPPSQGARVEVVSYETVEVPGHKGVDEDEELRRLGAVSLGRSHHRGPSTPSRGERTVHVAAPRGPSAPSREERMVGASSSDVTYNLTSEDRRIMAMGAAYLGETHYKGWRAEGSPINERWKKAVLAWVGMFMTNTEKVAPMELANRAYRAETAQHAREGRAE